MTPRNSDYGHRTIERVAYGFALKSAIRLGGGFRAVPHRQHVITLRLPADAVFTEYQKAARILVADNLSLCNFDVVWPKIDRRGQLNVDLVKDAVDHTGSFLIIWPPGHDLPSAFELASDGVINVEPVRPCHLVVAAKMVSAQVVELADAKAILQYPLPSVFAAMRRGRPVSDVLRRLGEAKPASVSLAEEHQPRLEDLVGYGEAKTWGLSLAQDLREWEDGRLSWSDVDRGLLLSGPPGTGKTMFAGALARSCGAHLVATSAARWQSAGYLSDTLVAMRRAFEEAIANRPSILFLDELDAIGDRSRLGEGEHKLYWTQCVNLLLELMDGHTKLEGVVVLGATNHPEAIDPALLRPGRLDRHLKIGLPDFAEREHLARIYFDQQLSPTDLKRIVAATAGFTGAAFERAGRQVRREARRAKSEIDVEMVMRALPPATKVHGFRRRKVALHEAAHAVVAISLGLGPLECVVVLDEARESQPFGFAHLAAREDHDADRQFHLNRIAFFLAGRAAEEEFLGTAYEGAGGRPGSDLHIATDIATELEVLMGMGEGLAYFDVSNPQLRDRLRRVNPDIAARVERVLVREMKRSREIVRQQRSAIEALADALDKRGHIEGAEVASIIAAAGKVRLPKSKSRRPSTERSR
ncbi:MULTISPECIES: AAA family ATPase [unclassified Rhizobium]|uniref:AAA family ATPase n=1 Tax=unclassified Rhizobium TaxID=2613769 RepID=UPI001ADAF4A2|nr:MULTISPECIES: AAA family ATPase [unclassified Rhizobium]MBO9126928.1 AAA family ATPase [Rhizobium sp. 16-488-2b]MBO9177376.1 AAA family ATPase [Rhizobium sp. 16-488-2a]